MTSGKYSQVNPVVRLILASNHRQVVNAVMSLVLTSNPRVVLYANYVHSPAADNYVGLFVLPYR